MKLRGFFVWFVVLFLLCWCVEPKVKKRGRHNQRRLRELCRKQKMLSRSSQENSALELHAFFDLRPRDKAFACLKVSTCHGKPVCFVTSYPHLKTKAINDSTTWQALITYIQKDRKIEPIYDSSLNGWNGNKYKTLSHYVQNQPAIYRMCRDATIYRFVHGNDDAGNATSHVKRAINSSSPLVAHNVTETTTTTNSNIDPVSLCPLFANKKQHRKRKTKSMRTKRVSRQNATSSNFMLCQGFHCPCVRICVGQGRNKQSFSDCSTFRIICTFNCNTSANIFPPFSPKRTSKPTRKPRGRQKVQRVRKRPRRKPKPKSRKGKKRKKNGK